MQGGWARDVKQGLGRKVYANGDTHEGLWQGGRAEGPGRYKWANRNEYDGQWQGGRMHGQGTLLWNTGNASCWCHHRPLHARHAPTSRWACPCKHGIWLHSMCQSDASPSRRTANLCCQQPADSICISVLLVPRSACQQLWLPLLMTSSTGLRHAAKPSGLKPEFMTAGDRYDGEFTNGQEDGLGIFTWADGTTYEGHWQRGQKHGIGLYRPSCEPDRRSMAALPSSRHEGVTACMLPLPSTFMHLPGPLSGHAYTQ